MEQTIILTSPDFDPFGRLPDRHTCEDQNINPELHISQFPSGTQSFALIVDDVDAIRPEGPWVHWLIWNLGPSVTTIGDNSVPHGSVQGKNSFGKVGWMGPCPPAGSTPHHYRFTVYALNQKLDLAPDSNKFDLQQAMEGKILGTGELIGEYSRPASA